MSKQASHGWRCNSLGLRTGSSDFCADCLGTAGLASTACRHLRASAAFRVLYLVTWLRVCVITLRNLEIKASTKVSLMRLERVPRQLCYRFN